MNDDRDPAGEKRKKISFEIDPTVMLIAQVVVAIYTMAVAVVAYIGRDSAQADFLDQTYHVSANIEKRLSRDFEFGFGKAFVFDDRHPDPVSIYVPQQLLFKRTKTQSAEFLINATSHIESGPRKPLTIKILLDNRQWDPDSQDPSRSIDFTSDGLLEVKPTNEDDQFIHLRTDPGEWTTELPFGLHSLKIEVSPHPGQQALVTVNVYVIVSNPHKVGIQES